MCRWPIKSNVKYLGSTKELHSKLTGLSVREENGIHGVTVKCVDIVRNTSGEGDFLADC